MRQVTDNFIHLLTIFAAVTMGIPTTMASFNHPSGVPSYSQTWIKLQQQLPNNSAPQECCFPSSPPCLVPYLLIDPQWESQIWSWTSTFCHWMQHNMTCYQLGPLLPMLPPIHHMIFFPYLKLGANHDDSHHTTRHLGNLMRATSFHLHLALSLIC